jgi:hypothetical protein
MTIDLNPNIVISKFLKKSVSFFNLDSKTLTHILYQEIENLKTKNRLSDRRSKTRPYSGRRHCDLINYI